MNTRNVTSIVCDVLRGAGYSKAAIKTLRVTKEGKIVVKVPYTAKELDALGAKRLQDMFDYLRIDHPGYHPDFSTAVPPIPNRPGIVCELFRFDDEDVNWQATGKALCHPDDEFSYLYGQALAMARMINKHFNKSDFLREFQKDWA